MYARADFGHNLTKKEMEVSGLVAQGLTNEQIADRLYLSKGTVKNHMTSIYLKTGVQNRAQLTARYVAEYEKDITEIIDASMPDELSPSITVDAKLQLVGLNGLPSTIPLNLQYKPFVIGRFSATIGQKQCDFEFGRDTKAVSRLHAAIERTNCGIIVHDLNSRAGTFINGKIIAPGKPCFIKNGDRLSFGTAGADYIFEEN